MSASLSPACDLEHWPPRVKAPNQLLCPQLATKSPLPCFADPRDDPTLHSLLTLRPHSLLGPFLLITGYKTEMLVLPSPMQPTYPYRESTAEQEEHKKWSWQTWARPNPITDGPHTGCKSHTDFLDSKPALSLTSCVIGQVTQPLWSLATSSAQWDNERNCLLGLLWGWIKLINVKFSEPSLA